MAATRWSEAFPIPGDRRGERALTERTPRTSRLIMVEMSWISAVRCSAVIVGACELVGTHTERFLDEVALADRERCGHRGEPLRADPFDVVGDGIDHLGLGEASSCLGSKPGYVSTSRSRTAAKPHGSIMKMMPSAWWTNDASRFRLLAVGEEFARDVVEEHGALAPILHGPERQRSSPGVDCLGHAERRRCISNTGSK